MINFSKHFWTAAVSLAAVVGLYFAAADKHVLLAFWIVIVLSFLTALLLASRPKIIEIAKRFRDYPRLLKAAGQLQVDKENLEGQLKQAQEAIKSVRTAGVLEGRRQAAGALLSQLAPIPQLTGIESRNGQLLLMAKAAQGPPVGAWYFVESKYTGEVKGVVEAKASNTIESLTFLECVELTIPDFWRQLAEATALNTTPPSSIILTPYKVPSPDTAGQNLLNTRDRNQTDG